MAGGENNRRKLTLDLTFDNNVTAKKTDGETTDNRYRLEHATTFCIQVIVEFQTLTSDYIYDLFMAE